MASSLEFVEFVADQVDDSCDITYRKMFGEYALYSKGKVVALICDEQLFVKPTEAGRKYIGDVVEAPPYPGARNSFLIGLSSRRMPLNVPNRASTRVSAFTPRRPVPHGTR